MAILRTPYAIPTTLQLIALLSYLFDSPNPTSILRFGVPAVLRRQRTAVQSLALIKQSPLQTTLDGSREPPCITHVIALLARAT